MLCRAFACPPRDSLKWVESGDSCYALIVKWFQELELAHSPRRQSIGREVLGGSKEERREEARTGRSTGFSELLGALEVGKDVSLRKKIK